MNSKLFVSLLQLGLFYVRGLQLLFNLDKSHSVMCRKGTWIYDRDKVTGGWQNVHKIELHRSLNPKIGR